MVLWNRPIRKQAFLIAAICLCFIAVNAAASQPTHAQAGQESPTQAAAAPRPVGTIKSISGNTIILTTDAAVDVTVQVQVATKLVRIAAGQKDLKDATPIQLADVQPGDRILVRGKLADDGKSVLALTVIAMKKADVAEKQAHDREEWQKYGTGGLVSSVDAATSTVTISLPTVGEKKSVAIHLSKTTVLRRYAPDSVKFDDAKPAPLDQIKPGDQLRARGARNADGSELMAVEIVDGTFRNIAGIISAIDATSNGITLQDLATKKAVTVKITGDSQLRKLPLPMAQRIAARLKGIPADAAGASAGAAAAGAGSNANASATEGARPAGPPSGGAGAGGFGGPGRNAGGGPGDLQQMMNRMPAAGLADLQKGDAVDRKSTRLN